MLRVDELVGAGRHRAAAAGGRVMGAAAVAALIALVAAGCGSSSKSSSSTSSPSATSAAIPGASATTGSTGSSPGSAAPSGAPIVVGNVSNLTNVQAGIQPDDSSTPNAWVKWTNAHGGINGHPVKLIQLDDGADPGKALADVQQLVQQDHVVALVGNADTATDAAYASYLESHGVPNLAGADFSTVWETNPDYFPTMATVSTKGYADDYAAKYAGLTSVVGAYCSNIPACIQDVQAQKAAASQVGVNYTIGPSANFVAPNYTAQCLVMTSSHPAGLYFSSGIQAIEEMATNCAQQGYKGEWILPQPDDTQLTVPALDKNSIGQDLELPFFAQIPATADFRQAMSEYAPSTKIQIDSLRIWAGFDVLKKALEVVASQPASPQAVKNGLYAITGFNDNGLIPPIHFVSGQPTVVKCFILWGIKDGQFVLPQGDTYDCRS
jgi:branched-chain amino acid transport system substrate-binding protein